jgi:hypothetical protein
MAFAGAGKLEAELRQRAAASPHAAALRDAGFRSMGTGLRWYAAPR